jgi:hypothetical protein
VLPDSLLEPEASADAEGLPEEHWLALRDANRASEADAVGEVLREREPVAVLHAVADTLLLRVGLPEPVYVGREESEGEMLDEALSEPQLEALGLSVALALWESLLLPLSLPLEEAEAEGLCVTLKLTTTFVPECTGDAVATAEPVFDTVMERVLVPVPPLFSEGDEVGDVLCEGHALVLGESEKEALPLELEE